MLVLLLIVYVRCLLSPAQASLPVVAIHDSELTRALETMPANGATPTGSGTTGKQWWPLNWHYFVMPESVEEALRSDGTPFQVVGDSNILSGVLMNADGTPKFPIVISLASEAISNDEIAQFTNYVAAGGFLFVGSSAFTRNADGTTRGDFAFANAMGIHMVNPDLANWYADELLTVTLAHPIVSHIPSGQLWWRMPLAAENINWGISPSHSINYYHLGWQVQASDATVVASGGDTTTNFPYLLVKSFGKGYFVYHAGMQPLIGHGGNDSGMYAYGIFRNAIQWAFQTANLPVPRLSPWPYQYDAAVMFRHDFENCTNFINTIEASAQFEHSVTNAFSEPAKGDYYFCTGTLRTEYSPADQNNKIASLSRAITFYGATIGSHNGGLPNAQNLTLATNAYDYWHWGPDEALDLTNPPPTGFANGAAYAFTSISNSFSDIRGWGLTNNTSLREWVSPSFNATREASKQILAQLGIASAGEEKLGPFPHWTLSSQTSGLRYPVLSLPVSDWYVGTLVGQAIEGQSLASVDALVDYYYNLGALINLYGHSAAAGPSIQVNNGAGGILTTSPQLQQEYLVYSMAKPRVWPANADSLYSWWVARSNAIILVTNVQTVSLSTTTFFISGSQNTNTAVEIFAPSTNYSNLQVFTNGVQAGLASYRMVGQTIRVLVGTTVTNVQISYALLPVAQNDAYFVQPAATLTVAAPGVLANDTVGSGINLTAVLITGPTNGSLSLNSNGSFIYTPTNSQTSDSFTYLANDGKTNSAVATVSIAIISPPVITSQPISQTNTAGTSASFTVGSTSGAPVTYIWFMNATNQLTDGGSISGAATATLTISSVSNVNSGAYTVVIANPVGSVTSAPPATLTVTGQLDPDIVGTPVGFVQNGGSTVELSVIATGTSPFTYQWNYNGLPIPGANSALVVLTGVTNSGSIYSVVVSNSIGSVTGTVDVLQFMASGAIFNDNFVRDPDPDLILPWVAAIGDWTVAGQTLVSTSLAGDLASAYVNGTNWVDYSFQANVCFPAAGNAGAYGGGIGGRLNPATGAHYGAWIYPEGSPSGPAVMRLVKFYDWINWSFTPMQLVSLTNGVGTGWHTVNLAFKANEILVYYDGAKVVDVLDNDFDNLSPYAYGGITVDVWASSPAQAMVVSNVVVSDFPLTIINQPASANSLSGGNVTFAATVSGTPPLSFQWFKNGTPLSDGGNISGSATASLTINSATNTDEAIYGLLVTDVFGDTITSSNATLTMTGIPVITNQPVGLAVVANNTATFSVGASGDEPMSYQWYFNVTNAVGFNTNTLELNPVTELEAGSYLVIVTNASGSVTSTPALLTVYVPPTITLQPQSATILAGTTTEFTALATGNPPPSYQWQFNTTNIFGATASTLTLTNVEPAQAGIYTVVVQNLAGEATSSNAVLTVATIPVIATQPVGLTTVIGGTATLTVEAIGNGLNYQWLKNTSPMAGATNTTLTFTNLALGDMAIYSVIVSNAFGTVISSNAVLMVLDCITAPDGNVGWWPGDGTAHDIIGTNNGILQGDATATNAGVVDSCFSFDGTNGYVEIPDSPVLHPTNLTIEAWVLFNSLDSDSSNPGHQYIVFKQNSRGDQPGFEGFGLGKDRYPNVPNTNGDVLYFNVSSANGDTAEVDSTVIVTTNVWYHLAGVRGSNYLQLYVNGQLQGQVGVSFPQDFGTNSLYFGTTGRSQFFDGKLNGLLDEVSLYNRALASNEIAAIYLAGASGKCKGSPILGNPPVITNQPVGLAVVVSNAATFTVGASGAAPLAYQWYFNGTNAVGLNTNELALANVQEADAGDYRVVVTNNYGSVTSAVAVLTVSFPPVITLQPQSATNLAGALAGFSVTATGNPPPSYQWQFNSTNILGATTNTLTLTNVLPAQAGIYTVIVENPAGVVVSSNAVLSVIIVAPVITVGADVLNHTFGLTFPTQNGLSYHLEFKDDISSPNDWQEMTNFFGDGNPASLSIPTDAPTMRFFRLRVQ